MKRWLFLMCIGILLISLPAGAADELRLEGEVTGTRLLEKWNGETSEDHDWFIVDLQLTNWHTETQNIAQLLSGEFVFREVYRFEAEPSFGTDTIGPLGEKKGSLVFEIPKMVSRLFDDENVTVRISIDGEEKEVELAETAASGTVGFSGKLEGPGFESPQDAVLAYLNGLDHGDTREMAATFALESYVEHADPEDYLRRIRTFGSNTYKALPLNSEYARGLMLNRRYGDISTMLMNQYIELSAPTNGKMIMLKDEKVFQDVLDHFEDSPVDRWKDHVEFVEWIEPVCLAPNFYTMRNLTNALAGISCAGAEDYAELAAYVRLNGVDAIQTMECVRYDGRWYNCECMGYLAILCALDTRFAGLMYLGNMSAEDLGEDETEEETEAPYDIRDILSAKPVYEEEIRPMMDSWETSDLPGSCWELESFDISGLEVEIAPDAGSVVKDPGMSVFSDLRFMHLGGAILDLRISRGLQREMDTESSYMKTVALWSEIGGRLRFEYSKGVDRTFLHLSDLSCKREEDRITIWGEEGERFVYRRAR